MAETAVQPVLDYGRVNVGYRPRIRRAALAVFLPWLLQSMLVVGAYLPSKDGDAVHGWIMLVGLLVLPWFTGAMILRSRASFRLRAALLAFAVPLQFFCLIVVTEYVAIACGAADAF